MNSLGAWKHIYGGLRWSPHRPDEELSLLVPPSGSGWRINIWLVLVIAADWTADIKSYVFFSLSCDSTFPPVFLVLPFNLNSLLPYFFLIYIIPPSFRSVWSLLYASNLWHTFQRPLNLQAIPVTKYLPCCVMKTHAYPHIAALSRGMQKFHITLVQIRAKLSCRFNIPQR